MYTMTALPLSSIATKSFSLLHTLDFDFDIHCWMLDWALHAGRCTRHLTLDMLDWTLDATR